MTKPTISGEEYQKVQTATVNASSASPWQWAAIILAITTIGLTIALVAILQKPDAKTATDNQHTSREITAPGGNSQAPPTCTGKECASRTDGGGGIQPIPGTVVEATDTYLTINNNGQKRTFTITRETQEAGNGSQAAKPYDKSRLKPGDMVDVIPTTEGGSEAQLILSGFSKA